MTRTRYFSHPLLRHSSWVIAVLFLTGVVSCNLINPVEKIPGYLNISSISLKTVNSGTRFEGSSANGIHDAWVFIDNQYLGTYELPCTFPVLAEGSHKVSVRAGIIVNGISQNRTAYPEYKTWDSTVTITPGKTTSFGLTVNYMPTATFPQIEDFEGGGISLTSTGTGSAALVTTVAGDANAFEGHSGKTELDDNHPVFEVASSDTFNLPTVVPSWVELNYKCDNEFTVGLIISGSSGVLKSPLLNVRASSTWKKIYVNLTDLGGVLATGLGYKVYLHAEKSSGLTTADLYFDNLKVVY